MMKRYKPQEYWEKRLSAHFSLKDVGDKRFNERYNEFLYQSRVESLQYLIHKYKIEFYRNSVLDIGCGSGFWIDYFHRRRAKHICGIDITKRSIVRLQEKYPGYNFHQMDIGERGIQLNQKFDIVTAFDVFHHICDDQRFQEAIKNLSMFMKKGGFAIITDRFVTLRTPFVKHCKFRGVNIYRSEFQRYALQIKEVLPVFFVLGKAFIPFIGPLILNLIPSLLFNVDQHLKKANISNGQGLKLLLAQKS